MWWALLIVIWAEHANVISILKNILFIFRERWREREREGETRHCERETLIGCLSQASQWQLAYNPGLCSDWKSNLRPFALQNNPQATELHWSWHIIFIFVNVKAYDLLCKPEFYKAIWWWTSSKIAVVTTFPISNGVPFIYLFFFFREWKRAGVELGEQWR